MFTLLLKGATVLMLAIIIVFVIQTLRLTMLSHIADTRSKSFLVALKTVLLMPWYTNTPTTFKSKVKYFYDLISGKMFSDYKNYLSNVANLIKVRCTSDPTNPEVRTTVVNSFVRTDLIITNADVSDDVKDFKKRLEMSTSMMTHLINQDLRAIMSEAATVNMADEHPIGYDIISSIIKTSNLYDIDTNTIIIVALDYLQNADLENEYKTI